MTEQIAEPAAEFQNALSDFASSISGNFNPLAQFGYGGAGGGAQVSGTATLQYNLRNYFISNNRQLLTQLYAEHGIVQTLVDQPVEDAFRGGFEIRTGQLSADEIGELNKFWHDDGFNEEVMYAFKWARLYGGASILMMTDQDPQKPLDWDKITPDSILEFRATDLWELYDANANTTGDYSNGQWVDPNLAQFSFYGHKVDASRVFTIKGKRAPGYAARQLRGWGMSELEKFVRSLNQYLKNQDVIFELLDEAKIDVYKIKGFNTALGNAKGTSALTRRVQDANIVKNFLNALTMDAEDEYQQKVMTFTGLAEMLEQLRIQVASDLRMPMTKIFGTSPGGLNATGESDTENYNAMVESSVRRPAKPIVQKLLAIACRKLFGMAPDDIEIIWPTLRIVGALDEEKIKDSKLKRVIDTTNIGLIQTVEAKKSINAEHLLPVEIDETSELLPPIGMPIKDDEEGGNGADDE